MKVKELIEALQKVDGELPVMMRSKISENELVVSVVVVTGFDDKPLYVAMDNLVTYIAHSLLVGKRNAS